MFTSRRIATMGGDKFRDDFSLAFDGTNDHLNCGDSSDWDFSNGSASIFSVSVWFKSADGSPADNDTLISKYDTSDNKREWRISTDSSARVIIYVSGNGTNTMNAYSSYVVADTDWHHVVFTYDGSVGTANLRPTIYVDGVDYGVTTSGTFPAILNEDDRALTIAAFTAAGASASEWNGNISDVAIYNTALSASQVKTLYNGREPYNHKEGIALGNLKAWWRMGDGTFDQKATTDAQGGVVTDMVNPTLGDDVLGGRGNFTDNSDSYWTLINSDSGNNIEITGGVCEFKASGSVNGSVKKTGILTIGQMYRIDVDQTANSGTSLLIDDNNPYIKICGDRLGHHTIYFVPENRTDLRLYRHDSSGDAYDQTATIDNVVARPVNGNPGALTNMKPEDFEGDTP